MTNPKPIIKERESGIELLRIILMLQVIYLHVSNFGEFGSINNSLGGLNELTYRILQTLNRCPVYVFMIISGYFSVKSKSTMKNIWKKAGNIYSSMAFYSILLTAVLCLSGLAEANPYNVLKAFFPLTSRTWYFMTVYLLVLILSPVLNLALNKLEKNDFRILLVVLFVLFSLWQVVATINPIISVDSVIETTKGRGLYGFLFMYIVGAYIRLHTKEEEKTNWKYLIFFFALAIFDIILVYLLKDFPVLKSYLKIVNYNNAPVAVIQGIMLFMFFRTLRFRSGIINKISEHNLGVYMIHEHWLMRPVIWDKIFVTTQNPLFYSSPVFIPAIFGIILAIYISCWAIDLLRGFIFRAVKNKIQSIKNGAKQ